MSARKKIEVIDLEKQYTVKQKIGSGGFSQVFSAIKVPSGDRVALKDHFINLTTPEQILREYQLVRKIYHPLIVNYRNIFVNKRNNRIYIAMDRAPGIDLFAYIKRIKYGSEKIKAIIKQILCVLVYFNTMGLAHRDLKGENILVTKGIRPRVKVIDFGFLCYYNGDKKTIRKPVCETKRGTRLYAAPEIHLGKSWGNSKSDIWALGMILLELITKEDIYDYKSYFDWNSRILGSIIVGLAAIDLEGGEGGIPKEFKKLLHGMLEYDPNKRLTAKQALDILGSEGCGIYFLNVDITKDNVQLIMSNPEFDPSIEGCKIIKKLYQEEKYELITIVAKHPKVKECKKNMKILNIILEAVTKTLGKD